MAEYSMTYADAKNFVSDCIHNSPNPGKLEQYKAEILAALTMRATDIYDDMSGELRESLELWENQLGNPSELLLGTRYFSVKSSVLKLIQLVLTSGLMDAIIVAIQSKTSNPMYGITISASSTLVLGLIEIFESASELQDRDFCVYMQVIKHYRKHKKFQKQDLLEWFPHEGEKKCNIYASKWECEYCEKNGGCSILESAHLDCALRSLEKKKILKKESTNGRDYYSFVW